MHRSAADESVFHAIASPTRRALLEALASGEKSVSELVAAVPVSQSAVSQQLSVLKRVGLVEQRPHTQFRYYRLKPAPLSEVDQWVSRYRALIEGQLDALGRVLDEMPDAPKPSPNPKRRKKP